MTTTPSPTPPIEPLSEELLAEIEARYQAASPGPWESDNEQDSEHHYQYYMALDAESRTIFDTLNSSIGEIHEEADEDGVYRWDEVARRNIAFATHARTDIPALCQSLRAAWKQRDDALVRGAEDQDYDSERRAGLASENAALREQLVQAQSELKQWLQWGDRMTGGQHYLQSKMRYEIESRLAEAEKTTERNPA